MLSKWSVCVWSLHILINSVVIHGRSRFNCVFCNFLPHQTERMDEAGVWEIAYSNISRIISEILIVYFLCVLWAFFFFSLLNYEAWGAYVRYSVFIFFLLFCRFYGVEKVDKLASVLSYMALLVFLLSKQCSFTHSLTHSFWHYLLLTLNHFVCLVTSFVRLNTYAFEVKKKKNKEQNVISTQPYPIHSQNVLSWFKLFCLFFRSFFLAFPHCFVIYLEFGYFVFLFTWFIQHVWLTVDVLFSFVIHTRIQTYHLCLSLALCLRWNFDVVFILENATKK